MGDQLDEALRLVPVADDRHRLEVLAGGPLVAEPGVEEGSARAHEEDGEEPASDGPQRVGVPLGEEGGGEDEQAGAGTEAQQPGCFDPPVGDGGGVVEAGVVGEQEGESTKGDGARDGAAEGLRAGGQHAVGDQPGGRHRDHVDERQDAE